MVLGLWEGLVHLATAVEFLSAASSSLQTLKTNDHGNFLDASNL